MVEISKKIGLNRVAGVTRDAMAAKGRSEFSRNRLLMAARFQSAEDANAA